jgi:hypothetical protein
MKPMETGQLLSILGVARRLGINNDEAFELAFVTRELPVKFTAKTTVFPKRRSRSIAGLTLCDSAAAVPHVRLGPRGHERTSPPH